MESIEKSPMFKARLAKSEPFEDLVEAYLIRTGVEIAARNGTERTLSTFASQIRKRNDAAAKQIRFAPDFVAVDDLGVFYAEAKASINIERGPYEHYTALQTLGARLKLYIRPFYPNRIYAYWNYIEDVLFRPSEDVVARFSEDKRFPIVNGWISPRSANRYAGTGSGTDYKEIDLKSMIKIDDFYDDGPVIEVTQDATLNRQQPMLF